jgi:hypothetical protein
MLLGLSNFCINSHKDGSMDSDSMVDMAGRLERLDKSGELGIDNVDDVVFCAVFHNCHNRIHSHHHRRICHIDHNQIASFCFLLLMSV